MNRLFVLFLIGLVFTVGCSKPAVVHNVPGKLDVPGAAGKPCTPCDKQKLVPKVSNPSEIPFNKSV